MNTFLCRSSSASWARSTYFSIRFGEEVNGHGGADQDHKYADPCLRQLLCVVRAHVSADDSAGNHYDPVLPVDCLRHNKRHDGNSIDHESHHAFQGVHGVDIRHAESGQHGQHHDSHSSAEVAAIDGDGQ